jgi:ATP-dependent DNA helicase RecG
MQLDSKVTEIKGVGEAVAAKLAILGIRTIADMIDTFPRRYEDYSSVTVINQLQPGQTTIQAIITGAKGRYVRRGMHITEAIATAGNDSVRLIWFNQPYRATSIKSDQQYFISGNYELSHQRFAIMNPSIELVNDFPVNTARMLPVYRETKGFSSRQLRVLLQRVRSLIDGLPEVLPEDIITKAQLMSHADAMQALHFPQSTEQLADARRRLGFEEVFQLSLASLLNKQDQQQELGIKIPFNEKQAQAFVKHLPFTLTDEQRKVIWQICLDMQRAQPMNRLVEGDVGSGKTVVATMAALMVLRSGMQVALMAPTELLARQHAETIHKLLLPLGLGDRVGLLVGSLKQAQKQAARDAITDGRCTFIIGTQALIQDSVFTKSLGLVIIDEQHRFGVDQRKQLQAKAGHMPHVLSLTATPIPRSLALTLYGELDISVIAEKPTGRTPVITSIISPNSQTQLFADIVKQLNNGRQLFVVCPLISDSSLAPGASAEAVFKQLSKKELKNYRVGLLHGKLKPLEKNQVMQQFVRHKLDALIATTVIEVGVDVPNATMMLIESAERFGLAQAHQLRGRVGRGEHQGYCYLLLSDSRAPNKRLRALESSNDGFKLAELDLELRGPGAIYGTLQHGALDLRIAKLSDTKLIASARQAAQAFIDSKQDLLNYTQLAARISRLRTVTNLN